MFALRQAVGLFDFYQQQLAECDRQIEQYLKDLTASTPDAGDDPGKGDTPGDSSPKRTKKRTFGNAPKFDLQNYLIDMCGVDLTDIDGISTVTATTVISEIGTDMSKWPTEKHFCSWLGLCPDNRITGGKILSRRTRKVINRAATAFRMAAMTLERSHSALGAYLRRMKSRLGSAAAITATAHKLAKVFYNMLKFGKEYVDQGQDYYQQRYRDAVVKSLEKRASKLGFQLVQNLTAVGVS